MSIVLVTGAYGNIGQYVVAELLRKGHSVVAMDKPNPSTEKVEKRHRQDQVTTVWGDIRDKALMSKALHGVDAVVHMAAIIPPLSETSPVLANEINVDATRQLVKLMEASSTARRLVFASSMGIYGKLQKGDKPLQVDDEPTPDDHYGHTKLECEHVIKASTLDYTILRLSAAPPVNLASARSFKGNNMFEWHPDARVEIVHPQDAGIAFARSVDCAAAIGKIWFIGGGKTCRMTQFELSSGTLKALGMSPVGRQVFRNNGRIEMYGDWVDTEESQANLQYQNHSANDFFNELKASLGILYYLIKSVSPLATWLLVKKDGFVGQG